MARPQLFSRFAPALLGLAVLAAGCTVHKQETPDLSGPSELGTAIGIQVSPDVLTQDGASQSVVTITARDNNGAPKGNLSLRADIAVSGVTADFGTLSARNVVTDSSGRATLIFTAPPPPVGPAPTTDVQIRVTPVGTDFGNATARFAIIHLVPKGTVVPPQTSVTADFTITPSGSVTALDTVQFDGSLSKSTTGTIVQWRWSFGDGDTASGRVVTHSFDSPGNFSVTLTVTDSIGATNSVTRQVSVQGQQPRAVITQSPGNPIAVKQQVFFSGATSTGGTPTRPIPIVSFDWDFGDGSAHGSGVEVSHAYASKGTFIVLLTITDSTGLKGTITQSVTVQ